MAKPVLIPKVRKHWTMRDGTKIPIYKMSDQHLINTIKMLRRLAKQYRDEELNAAWSVYGTLQGEMASFFCEQDINHMEEDIDGERFLPNIYNDLLRDAERRGLTIDQI